MSKKLLLELLDFTRKFSPSNGKRDRTFILASSVQTLAMLKCVLSKTKLLSHQYANCSHRIPIFNVSIQRNTATNSDSNQPHPASHVLQSNLCSETSHFCSILTHISTRTDQRKTQRLHFFLRCHCYSVYSNYMYLLSG